MSLPKTSRAPTITMEPHRRHDAATDSCCCSGIHAGRRLRASSGANSAQFGTSPSSNAFRDEHRVWTVRSPLAAASALPRFGTHQVDGPAAIGTEPRVWEESGQIPRFGHPTSGPRQDHSSLRDRETDRETARETHNVSRATLSPIADYAHACA